MEKMTYTDKPEKEFQNNLNINVCYRILYALYNEGLQNKTNLAMYAKLNYNRCKKYVNVMTEILEWTKVVKSKDGDELIDITNTGRIIRNRLEIL